MSCNKPVIVSLKDLQNGMNYKTLEDAFGLNSLGILLVHDLPVEFIQLREKVLKSISALANLNDEELSKIESEESTWLVGWSRGKEKLASSGLPDINKGSYYVNCAFHVDDSLDGPRKELADSFANFKSYITKNLWPTEKGELIGFKQNVKDLCNIIIDVAEQVAYNCDKYISQNTPEYKQDKIRRIVKESTCTKARLLHYYPKNEVANDNVNDDWCGEHLDHSCITGLTSAMFMDESLNEVTPDPEAGLYIKNRKGEVVKVNIPNDCLAFQSGSTLQELSNGIFKAVPHYVKGSKIKGIARNTIAVFCQPNLDEKVNSSENFAEYATKIVSQNH